MQFRNYELHFHFHFKLYLLPHLKSLDKKLFAILNLRHRFRSWKRKCERTNSRACEKFCTYVDKTASGREKIPPPRENPTGPSGVYTLCTVGPTCSVTILV